MLGYIGRNMRITELLNENSIKLTGKSQKAQDWIKKVYSQFGDAPAHLGDKVMTWGTGDDMQFAAFTLVPSFTKRDAVEIKWIQAYPLRSGVGSKAIKRLQDLAKEDNIVLTLYPWDKGVVSQRNLVKFYKKQGFKPVNPGAKNMYYDPSEGP